MCGIAGIAVAGGAVPEQSLARASAALLHRGPDDGGIEIVRVPGVEVGLANRRLAIIDLSPAGHQPMFDADTGNWITYNGELYNFRALRAELEARGLTFRSHSDTEVILKAYGVWGEKCLDRFRGMFALAIWDAARRRLFVGRDPMGIKPLYYFQDGSRLVFASEVRALLATGLVPRRLAAAGLATYLMFGSVYDPFTLIEGVRALPAGHWLTWQDGRIETQEYWDVPHDAAAEGRVESASALPGLLDQTVELHTVSDVPIGVFLSGGIDSSALVALLSRRARVSTFSVVFREAEYNEAPFSRAVAERFHTDHHELTLSQQDALEAIPDALRAMDQPSMDGINTYIVSRQAVRAGLKVAMSGLGGDELFAGYDTFRRVPAMERFVRRSQRLPRPLRAPVAAAVGVLGGNTVRAQKLSALIAGEGGAVHPYFLSRMLFLPVQQAKLARGGTAQAAATTEQFMAENLSRAPASDAINRVSYLELRNYMLNTLLRDSDCMSMANSLELRVPFVDRELATLLFRLPGSMKQNAGTPKCLLVRALGDALPREIVYRRKRGFGLPFEDWMRDRLRQEVESTLRRGAAGPLGEHLDGPAVDAVWRQFLSGRTSWSRPWALYALCRWCENQIA